MFENKSLVAVCLTGFGVTLATALLAQSAGPKPQPLPPPIAAPADVPYPGTIRIQVDATDLDRHLFQVHETIPVRGGAPVVLLYPQWLPGNHSPTGRVDKVAGLIIRANGTPLEWVRDAVDVFAFHVNVPAGTAALDLDFEFTSALETNEGRVVMTPDMLNLQWTAFAIYPAGYFARQMTFEPSVRLPDGWQFATALETSSTSGSSISFKPVTLETLIDSPMFAGRYFKRVDLDPEGGVAVRLDIVADRPALLEAKPDQLEAHRALVQQAYRLFGSHHYNHYDLLLALTDRMGGIGLEHHQSSENGTLPTYFTEWDRNADARDLLAHEYAHSWNGKFRRPADLWTPNFNVPMRDSLLWVYEGQSQYWGQVLAARSGLWTKQQALDSFAATAATYDHRVGRQWRALQDTTNDPIAALRRPLAWRSWERSEDYYSEGLLIWLDADTLIREKSGDRRSLDDFAKAFFGINDGSFVAVTYTFDDVVTALNKVEAYDWATFLRTRLDGHGPGAPLDGLARGGYKLVYTDTPSDLYRSAESRRGVADLTYSLGMVIGRDGRIAEVLWDGPAFKLGLTIGTQVIAVGGATYSGDLIKETITGAKNSGAPIELLVKNGDRFRTVRFDYREGLRYPRLQRDAAIMPRLDQILGARK
jgi:predicted metalloprotease with PDZ domain